MSKYRIKFFSAFCDSENCKSVYERLCEVDSMDNYGEDKEIFITCDDNYTHAILINATLPVLYVPKENVVGLAFEPPEFLLRDKDFYKFIYYAKTTISKYFIGSISHIRKQPDEAPFLEHYGYMWHVTPPKSIPEKKRTMSIMVSDKTVEPGQAYRHELVREILVSDLDIDIYGRGCKYFPFLDSRIKGEFTDNEPYENYMFHICIENYKTPCYTSEKYTNAVLWGTTPIYWGADNSLFPSITIQLTGKVTEDMTLLRNIMENPDLYKKDIDQNEIRPKLNLLKNLDNIFS